MGNSAPRPKKEYKPGIVIESFYYDMVTKEDGSEDGWVMTNVATYQTLDDLLQDIRIDDAADVTKLREFVERNEVTRGEFTVFCPIYGAFVEDRLMRNGFVVDLAVIRRLCAGGNMNVQLCRFPTLDNSVLK